MRKHDVSTPQWLFAACNELALDACGSPLTLDACAAGWNAKCPQFYTVRDNALVQDWTKCKAVFLNPPYEKPRLHLFAEKALDAARHGTTVVLVLPVSNKRWYDLCERYGRIHRVVGPVVFRKKDGQPVVLADSHSPEIVIVVLGPGVKPGVGPSIRKGERAMSQEQFEKLSQKDQARRSALERIVDEWSKITFRAAEALHEIKRDRMYRSTHPSFEDYIDDRYGKTRQWAYDLINWYEVNEAAGTKDEPVSSTAARQLKGVKDDPKTVRKIVSESKKIAKKEGRAEPTARDISAAKAHVVPMVRPKQPPQRPQAQPRFNVQVWGHRKEVLQVLAGLGATITRKGQGTSPVAAGLETLGAFFQQMGKVLDTLEQIDLSIKGNKEAAAEGEAA